MSNDSRQYLVGLSRAAGGATIFAMPLFMTMEMWWLGFTIDPARLLLLVGVLLPTLTVLSYHAGFEPTFEWREDVTDAIVAYGVGFSAALLGLTLLGVITTETAFADAFGKVTVQAVPASFGAMLGRTLLGAERADEDQERHETYHGELFIMAAGALFLSFSIAPTEEITRLALGLGPGRTAFLALVSLGLMHAFVYAVEFRGQALRPEETTVAREFLRLTVAGYALALLISLYALWTFGRTDGLDLAEAVRAAVILGFPASIGAAAARLIL